MLGLTPPPLIIGFCDIWDRGAQQEDLLHNMNLLLRGILDSGPERYHKLHNMSWIRSEVWGNKEYGVIRYAKSWTRILAL